MNIRHFLLAVMVPLLGACSGDGLRDAGGDIASGVQENIPSGAVPGLIQIKIAKSYEDNVESIDFPSLGQYSIRRSIPECSRFEARHREAGLHLWYTISFVPDLPLSKASADLKNTEGIDKISYVVPAVPASVFPFNDPSSGLQWDLSNPGTEEDTRAGSDVNVLSAWEKTTGSPDVIVAVCDGAVDYRHEDLAGNIWTNEAEAGGQPGVDDDGNGYVDDIHGWNFLAGSDGNPVGAALSPNDHGTHIGGTIAAVNNNGIGICGIAGGDGQQSGVRLMSVQTSDDSESPAFIGNAIVYAADNGAVLMNCSWGIGEDTEFINEAIDYFNTYAGFDENGSQTGPVAGGLCIFAAGNDNATVSYPAMNSNVTAVASVGADYERAYYSNYGTWVDIAAPGGDSKKGYDIYSTVTLESGSYGYMQGTSMACPHVVGVAALIASRYGGPGFTREQLVNILLSSADPVIYEYNPAYAGMLGSGLVDAGAAVSGSEEPPMPVGDDLKASASGNNMTLSWSAPSDAEGNLPYSYDIYYSKNTLEDLDPEQPSEGVAHLVFTPGQDASEMLEYKISDLEFDTEYFIRLRTNNIFGYHSALSSQISCTTGSNTAPEIVALDGNTLTLKAHERGRLRFSLVDPDGPVTYEVRPCGNTSRLDGLLAALSDDGTLSLNIDALDAQENTTYEGVIEVSDSYETAEAFFSYSIGENHAPAVTGEIGDQVFGSRTEGIDINLPRLFNDPDGETLRYSCTTSSTSIVVKYTISGDMLDLDANSYGMTDVSITAADARGESATVTFKVLVRDGRREIDLYPNPVSDILNVRTGTGVTADIVVSSKSGAEVYSRKGVEISPFSPLQIDMSGLAGGVYYVNVKGGGIDSSYPVSKQ